MSPLHISNALSLAADCQEIYQNIYLSIYIYL